QVEVIAPFKQVVRKLIAGRHADTVRNSIVADDINNGHFRFLATILGVSRDLQWSEWSLENRSIALIEPLRRNADATPRRSALLTTPLEHAHAVGHLCLLLGGCGRMHGLSIAC